MADIGRRPVVVVLSRDAVIPRHGRALVAPCTTTIRGLASEVVLEPADDPVPLRSAVNLDSIESVSVATSSSAWPGGRGSHARDLCRPRDRGRSLRLTTHRAPRRVRVWVSSRTPRFEDHH